MMKSMPCATISGFRGLAGASSVSYTHLDEETLQPVEYFCKLPQDIAERDVLVLDVYKRQPPS